MSSQDTLAIEASGLVKTFGDTRAVDGVDLAVPRGAVYGVLGPNGAGKTTTIRMLATLLRPDAGSARVLGRDIVARGRRGPRPRQPDRAARVGRRGPHRPREPDPARAAARLLARPLQAARRGSARGVRARDATNRQVKNYSGGMRRRLDIAASIVVTPELMFLDEPTTGLDPRSRNQVWDIIRALVDQGTTVLLCTQYLDEADQLASRIAVIDHGRVIAEGTPGELKALGRPGDAACARARPGPARRGRARARPRARRARAPGVRPGSALRPGRGCRARGRRRQRAVRGPASASPTSRSASRASTRCSSR